MGDCEELQLASNHKHYDRMYEAYETLTDRFEKVQGYCSDTFPNIVIERFARNLQSENPEVFRYLGVGSGTGDSDVVILNQLAKELPAIEATIVEPSAHMIANFKERIAASDGALQKVNFAWNQATIEDYLEVPGGRDVKFHCIFLCGVMAYFRDIKQVVRQLYSLLAENGTVLIVTEAGNKTNIFFELWYPGRFPTIGETVAIPEDVVSSFEQLGAKVKVDDLECKLDGTSVFDEESEQGNYMLDFFSGRVHCRKTAPPEFVHRVIDFISNSGTCFKRDGKVFLKNNRALIIVQK